jgi:peptide-methionine (S)-S-oxide reductase
MCRQIPTALFCTLIGGLIALGVAFVGVAPNGGAGRAKEITMSSEATRSQVATFGAGCFWGVEEAFRQVEGVLSTSVGYAGGTMVNPTYRDVCSGRTGHAEVVRVEYDPETVSYDDLLRVFWTIHDPTTRDRQGPDVGSQYRSAIFYHSPEQQAAAETSIAELEASGRFRRPIVTAVEPAGPYYPAEDYHQKYLAKRGRAACATTVRD